MAVKNQATHVGALGDHPVGGAVGAAVGAATGAAAVAAAKGGAIGAAAAGPAGAIAGVAVGGVIGALAGKGIAQEINPTTEDAYWRENYGSRPYMEEQAIYDDYEPAYRYGWEAYSRYEGRDFDAIEPQLGKGWETARGKSPLSWDKARHATRDAYHRLYTRQDEPD